MTNFLFSNGCSFLTKRKGFDNHTGVLLSEHFGLSHIGLAAAGRGNDRLVFTTKMFFYENPQRIKDTFAVIGWTNPARIDYINNYKKDWISTSDWGETWFSLKREPAKVPTWDTYKQVKNYGNLLAKMLRQTLELQDFFENLGIKYCMYHSLNIFPHNVTVKLEKLALLRDRIKDTNFYKFNKESQQLLINKDRQNFVVSKKDLHPNDKGHKAWSDKIRAFIEKNNLL
tara:strand:+ start:2276 stop:2959 length:684 start_codon:yes stop_codon:yes gene_type:complete